MYRNTPGPGLAPLVIGILALGQATAVAQRWTLDQAIDRLTRENQVLRALQLEVPQAEADVAAAWHRGSMIQFTGDPNAGAASYRVEPLQVVPKRWAHALVARRAKEVLEAQYQNALRQQTENLYTAYVDLQVAQTRVQMANGYLRSMETLAKTTERLLPRGQAARAEVARVAAMQSRAAIALAESETAVAKARMTLANLLALPIAEAGTIEAEKMADPRDEEVPPVEELIELALQHRADLHSYRLGLQRAWADMIAAWLDQFPDLSVRLPRNPPRAAPAGAPGNAPRALPVVGLFVTFPDATEARARLARASINITQTRLELSGFEQDVILDVRRAHLELQHSLTVQRQYRNTIVPAARLVRDDTFRLYQGGEVSQDGYLDAQRDYNDTFEAHLNAMIRQRRSMLELNTAVGKRIFP